MDVEDTHDNATPQQQQDQIQLQSLPQSTAAANGIDYDTPQQMQLNCDAMGMSTATQTTPTMSSSLPQIHARQDVFPNALPMPAPHQTQTPVAQTVNSSIGVAPSSDADIDSQLLQQFSRMGTTDHEDLISQFQCIMNNQMSRSSARFYLEMNNWNLQTAVGSYFEYCGQQAAPSLQIKLHEFISAQQQAFRLENNGTQRWPENCFLSSPTQAQRIPLPALRTGETCDVVAETPVGMPEVMWRACTATGCYFGDAIWVLPLGIEVTKDELSLRAAQLITTDIRPELYPQMMLVVSAQQPQQQSPLP